MKAVSVLLGLLLVLSLFGEENAVAPEQTGKKTDFQTVQTESSNVQTEFQTVFLRDFQSLFEMLGREYPDFLRMVSGKDAEKALTAVMKALRSGVEVDSSGTGAGGKPEDEKKNRPVAAEPVVLRLRNGIWYLRISELDRNAFELLRKTAREAEQSPGLIVDLRSCSSGEWSSRPKEIGELFRPSPLHTVLLIGPGTAGAGEILAARFLTSHRGIGIGEPTAGKPFGRKEVTVSSRKWLVPQPPAGAEEVRYEPCQPQIRVAPGRQAPVEKLKRDGNPSETEDPALIRASDLLISLDLLEQKGLKK